MAKPKQQHITSTIRKYTVTIVGMTPYSQSKMLLEKRGVGEDWDSYEARVWQQKMHVEGNDPTNEDARIVIPASALSQCVAAYAQLRGEKIVGKGNKTWTKLFLSGVRVLDDAPTSKRVQDVYTETNMCDSQGNKGSSVGDCIGYEVPCGQAPGDHQLPHGQPQRTEGGPAGTGEARGQGVATSEDGAPRRPLRRRGHRRHLRGVE